ncbi:hypothetical protein [Prevotella histicola]|uniref:hypothetical protein n=1 Tax=Prevotella histicola TaxID=470565 RepID=UPI0028F05C1C|nr:hypothetical protein [Prevotella histicola]
MANWASTSYCIEGSKKDLKRLYKLIDGFMTGKEKPFWEDSAENWLGNVIKALGATEEQMKNNYLRGFIETYELDGDVLRIAAEEAWGTTDFRHILKKLMPELTIYYIVEEPGFEVYATNDADGKYFTERFNVDACVDGHDYWEYFQEEKETMDYVASLLKKDNITEADITQWNMEHEEEGDFIHVHEFEIVEN